MAENATNIRPSADQVMVDIAAYVSDFKVRSAVAFDTAHLCLLDALGCAFAALSYPECTKLLGPVVAGTIVPNGARIPGTSYVLDPVRAAFNMTSLIRWLEYNDATWGETVSHPSDTFGTLLVVADWLSRERLAQGKAPLLVRDVLEPAIKAYEIQGALGIENEFRRLGFDHTILVKIATTAVVTRLLGGSREEIINALSNAWVDGQTLATFRSKPNVGSRKSWAAGDSASRGVMFALMALQGEMGYPLALTAKRWGFYDVLFKGKSLRFQQPYGSHIIENILFKIPSPTAFHAQTVVEAAIKLHPLVKDRIREIRKVEIWTHASAIMILDKSGPLHNPADRDHCLQYAAAVGMLLGHLFPEDYEDKVAADPRIDALRGKMVVREDRKYTRGYSDPKIGSNANAICVHFADGSSTGRVEVQYPLGHRRRRKEGIPVLLAKFERHVASAFSKKRAQVITALCMDRKRLAATPVNALFDLLAK